METGTPRRTDGQIRRYIEAKYGSVAVDDRERLMEGIVGLVEYGRDQGLLLHLFFDRVTHLISRSLAFDEIIIGLYDRKENAYCNEVVFGYRNDIALELKRLRYSNEDLINQQRSQRVKIGKLSEFHSVEGLAKSEQKVFEGLSRGAGAAKSTDRFEKGHFIDICMRDPRVGLVGWIKVSHPHDSRLPTKINVLWLELIASICACVVSQHWHQEDQPGRTANG